MLERIIKEGLMIIGLMVVMSLAIIFASYLIDKIRVRLRNKPLKTSIKQVQSNNHIYCMDDCMYKEFCGKHKSLIEYPNEEYLLAHMKDTPYCSYDERFIEMFKR